MTPRIDPEFAALIPPAPPAERAALEAALVRSGGAEDALVTWRGLLVDGHTRFEICERLGLGYDTREIDLPDRAAVKAWILENQCARRNLSRFQRIMLLVRAGAERPPYAAPSDWTLAQRGIEGGFVDDVIAGRLTQGMLRNRLNPRPRTPRGPSKTPAIPEGHELKGLSTLTGPDGEERGAWAKTQIAASEAGPEHAPVPEGHLVKKTSTAYGPDGTVRMQWVQASADEARRELAMREAWARHAAEYAGLASVSTPPATVDAETITLYPLGDPHVGMLSWAPETGDHFDARIACRELLACVRVLVAGAAPSEHAIVCNLGDFLHAQDDSALTPGHGNQLDVDGRFAKVLDMGHTLLRGIVDAALERHARVTVRNLPGNHDPRVAAELAMWLKAVYERDERVNVADAFAAHQYDRFGACLFGWHHGDRSKATELPAIMATDRAEDWGQTTERVWHVGHVHHLTRHETPGCVVETHRTLAARDAWHAGRYRAGRSLAAITYHRVYGEIARQTVNVARVRAALSGKAS